jgi:hypothetical protein
VTNPRVARHHSKSSVLLTVAVALTMAAVGVAQTPTVVIIGATGIGGISVAPRRNATVVVTGDRITCVGAVADGVVVSSHRLSKSFGVDKR